MKRLTVKSKAEYILSENISENEAIKRLAAFENMYEALINDLDRTLSSFDELKSQQKTKTATYRQLFAEKLKLLEIKNRIDFWL